MTLEEAILEIEEKKKWQEDYALRCFKNGNFTQHACASGMIGAFSEDIAILREVEK